MQRNALHVRAFFNFQPCGGLLGQATILPSTSGFKLKNVLHSMHPSICDRVICKVTLHTMHPSIYDRVIPKVTLSSPCLIRRPAFVIMITFTLWVTMGPDFTTMLCQTHYFRNVLNPEHTVPFRVCFFNFVMQLNQGSSVR